MLCLLVHRWQGLEIGLWLVVKSVSLGHSRSLLCRYLCLLAFCLHSTGTREGYISACSVSALFGSCLQLYFSCSTVTRKQL